jgi:hypothetical protein
MGNKNSTLSDNTINWNGVRTDDMSSPDIKLGNLKEDAKILISKLPNLNNLVFTESPVEDLYNRIYQSNNNINENSASEKNINESENSKTSPFISDEMYNYLVETSSKNDQKGGNIETSTTIQNTSNINLSSSSVNIDNITTSSKYDTYELENSSLEYSGNIDKNNSNNDNHSYSSNLFSKNSSVNNTVNNSSLNSLSDNETITNVDLSPNSLVGGTLNHIQYDTNYQSSSAHTSSSEKSDSNNTSYIETTISIGNKKILSDSINTSDINIITVEE